MPRFNDVETITFTDINGIQYPVKDTRLITNQVLAFQIDKRKEDLIDEVASREEVFGEFGELQSWRIFDINIVKLTEVNFDITRIDKLKIPI